MESDFIMAQIYTKIQYVLQRVSEYRNGIDPNEGTGAEIDSLCIDT